MSQESQEPIVIYQSGIALMRNWKDEVAHWLVLRDDLTGQRQLVEAARLENESFRESIDREVAWQLNLRRGKDFIVSSVPRLHLEIPVEITHGCSDNQEKRVDVIEFYLIELYGKQARKTIEELDNIEWWSADQLLAETDENQLLSRQQQLLRMADILKSEHPNE